MPHNANKKIQSTPFHFFIPSGIQKIGVTKIAHPLCSCTIGGKRMNTLTQSPIQCKRLRRLRKSGAIRSLVEETTLLKTSIIVPLFITDVASFIGPIDPLPGIQRYSLDGLLKEIDFLTRSGFDKLALFPLIDPSKKDPSGSEASNPNGLIQTALRAIKHRFPHVCLFSDIALDPYTTHGHDGIINSSQEIDNDLTVEALQQQALSHADAGADFVAPSDMMDGRVQAIRNTLDTNNFYNTGILSYTAKYASSLYGPFRTAINTTLSFGDKKTYQMNPANKKEAFHEALIDQDEGADLLMVKPALSYLDIIHTLSESSLLPVGAYHVSGEYAMVMAAHKAGYLDAPSVLREHLLSIKRAGASFIYTYAYQMLIS